MTREEAIRILDPETTIEALAEIEYYAGFSGPTAKVQAVDAACVIAVADMRAMQELVTNRSQLNCLEPDAINRIESDTVKGGEIDQFNWIGVKDTPEVMVIIHRQSLRTRQIVKGGAQ